MSGQKKSKLPVLCCIEVGKCVEENIRKIRIELLFKKSEKRVLDVINSYIHNQKDPTCTKLAHDVRGYSVLHLAAERNFPSVAEKLLDSGFDPLTPACSEAKQLALHLAIENKFDDMAALLVRNIAPPDVRELFVNNSDGTDFVDCKRAGTITSVTDETTDILSINYLIRSDCRFVKTIMAILDSLKDVHDSGLATVYVKLLEEDGSGLEPKDEEFNYHYHTVFHNLVYAQKEVTNHPVIGLLINHKWNMWCRRRFVFNFCMYLLSLFALTFSIVIAASADDERTYNSSLHRTRACFEVTVCIFAFYVLATEVSQILRLFALTFSTAIAATAENERIYNSSLHRTRACFEVTVCIFAFYVLATEVSQITRHMRDYWKQFFNWIELLSSGIIFVAIVLRFTTKDAHWFVLAVAYMLWVLRIFKYAAVSSQTGAYTESLRQILTRNFVPFSLLFIVVNVAFGGIFLLVLRGEGSLHTHEETSSIFGIWFVGLRTMIEAGSIVEYAGSDGYGTAGIIVMLVFMTMTIVVLLNILIAQLSDTYSQIQSDAVKSVRANRVAIITRLERNEWRTLAYLIEHISGCGFIKRVLSRCGCIKWLPERGKSIVVGNRNRHYKSIFENIDLRHQYQSYSTPLEDMDEKLQELQRLHIKTDLIAQTLKSRLRQLDEKCEKNFSNLDKKIDVKFLEIKDLLKRMDKSDDDITKKLDSETESISDTEIKGIPESKVKLRSVSEINVTPHSEINDKSDSDLQEIRLFKIKDLSDPETKDKSGSEIKKISETEV